MKKMKIYSILILLSLLLPSLSIARDTNISSEGKHGQFPTDSLNHKNITGKPHVVIAVIDSGINVYHEVFRRPNLTIHPSVYIEEFSSTTEAINLTFHGNYSSNFEADKQIWEGYLNTQTLYWFPQTNIIGISFGQLLPEFLNIEQYPIIDEFFHGTGVASVIAKENPNATIVMVEAGSKNLEEAFLWAVNQSWIDIITTEYGMRYRPLSFLSSIIQWAKLPSITKRGYEQGKIIIVPTGNRPWINSMLSPLSGPPWVITVGGAEPYCHGASLTATKGADYVSSFTQNIAFYENTTMFYPASGTSLSVPMVAS
ncbi:MAG: S8/S53 family peptidase, partial [Methanobacteriota archaeon]